MIKTLNLSSEDYELLNFSINLLTNIYKTNKDINGIYTNYFYRDDLIVVRLMLISNKSLKLKELSRFDNMINTLYENTGIKIEIYNSINDDYNYELLYRRQWESCRDLIHGDILYDKDGSYQKLKEDLLLKEEYLPPYIHTLKLNIK